MGCAAGADMVEDEELFGRGGGGFGGLWFFFIFVFVGELEIMGSQGAGEGITGWERGLEAEGKRTGGRGKERGVPFERKFGLCGGDDKMWSGLERVLERWYGA